MLQKQWPALNSGEFNLYILTIINHSYDKVVINVPHITGTDPGGFWGSDGLDPPQVHVHGSAIHMFDKQG